MQDWIVGVGVGLAVTGGFALLSGFLPGLVVKKLHALFDSVRKSAWVRDPAKPKRLELLKAFLAWAEDELPEAGTGSDFYANLGASVATHLPPLLGSPGKWAKVLQKTGDALDTELDADLKELN